jgi:hypothetical protein
MCRFSIFQQNISTKRGRGSQHADPPPWIRLGVIFFIPPMNYIDLILLGIVVSGHRLKFWVVFFRFFSCCFLRGGAGFVILPPFRKFGGILDSASPSVRPSVRVLFPAMKLVMIVYNNELQIKFVFRRY